MPMDELPESARALLALAREADRPPPGARERVRDGVLLAIAAGASIGASSAGTAVAAGAGGSTVKAGLFASTASKVLLAGSVVTVIGTASVALRPAPQAPSALRSSVMEQTSAKTPAAAQAKPHMPPSAAGVSVEEAQPVPLTQPAPAAQEPAPTTKRHRAEPATAPQDDLGAEVTLLSSASSALDRGDVSTARDALLRHREQFARGQLSEERRGLDVLARCVAGEAGALQHARRYLQSTPASVLTRRIEASCVKKVAP